MSRDVTASVERISMLIAAESHAEALAECDDALRRGLDAPELHTQRASALQALGRADEAIEVLGRASALRPDHAGLALALGELLLTAHRDHARAEPLFRRAVALEPADARGYLGFAECQLPQLGFPDVYDRAGEALAAGFSARLLLEALVLQLCNHGRYREARAAAGCLAEQPDAGPQALLGLARVADEGEHDYAAARRHLAAALGRFPGHTLCHLAHLALLAKVGKWEEAARSARAMVRHFGGSYPRFAAPTWDGSPLEGRTVLLDSGIARGFGDALHFARFAGVLRERGARVGIRARACLASILATVPGVDFVVAPSEPAPGVDCVCEMSLAWLLLGLAAGEVAPCVPYLRPSPATVADWGVRIPAAGPTRVGLAWFSADRRIANRYTAKNVPVPELARLAGIEGVRLVSLQTFPATEDLAAAFGAGTVAEFGPHLSDFMQTAGLVSQLDAVVTVDTAVAHLAGALGKPTILLLPFSAEWRWLVDRADTPWYPSMRLVRQPAPGDWRSAVGECVDVLRGLRRRSVRSS